MTLHRPANVDDPAVLGGLLSALAEISRGCPLVLAAPPPPARQPALWVGQAGRRIAATLVDGQVG